MFSKEIKSIIDLVKAFPTEQSCIDYLEAVRWGENVVSPFDANSKVYKCKGNKYRCKNTNKYFNVKTATIFDNSKLELQKWFFAIWIVTAHKKGISSLQLGRDLDITQKSAWFMLQRIRNCFGIDLEKGNGIVEIDETYVGGDNKNKSNSKRAELHANGAQTGGKHKVPVVGMLERGKGVKAVVIGKGMSNGKNIKPIVKANVPNDSIIVTDGFGAYKDLPNRNIVNHTNNQYVNGIFHTNTIEGFWSLLKRGIYGIYHAVSPKHLQKYVNEFSYRYNNRKSTDYSRFNDLLGNIENRLTYKELIHANSI
jgi:transposase-like protein